MATTIAWDIIGGVFGLYGHLFRDPVQEELEETVRERTRVLSYTEHLKSHVRAEEHVREFVLSGGDLTTPPPPDFSVDTYAFVRSMAVVALRFSIEEHEATSTRLEARIAELEKILSDRAAEKLAKQGETASAVGATEVAIERREPSGDLDGDCG